MKKQEVFDYIDEIAVRCHALNYGHCGAKKRIAGLKTDESVLLVFEQDKVDVCGSVHYCTDPKTFGLKEIVKVTKESPRVWSMTIIPVSAVKSGKTYR